MSSIGVVVATTIADTRGDLKGQTGSGAALRYVVDFAVQSPFGGVFPLGTFVVNATGSLLSFS